MLLDKWNLNSLEYSLSEDIKVMIQTLGKQRVACSHHCPYCETSKPDILKAPHNTLASLCAWHDKWISAGGKLKEAKYILSKCCTSPFANWNAWLQNLGVDQYSGSAYSSRNWRQNSLWDGERNVWEYRDWIPVHSVLLIWPQSILPGFPTKVSINLRVTPATCSWRNSINWTFTWRSTTWAYQAQST